MDQTFPRQHNLTSQKHSLQSKPTSSPLTKTSQPNATAHCEPLPTASLSYPSPSSPTSWISWSIMRITSADNIRRTRMGVWVLLAPGHLSSHHSDKKQHQWWREMCFTPIISPDEPQGRRRWELMTESFHPAFRIVCPFIHAADISGAEDWVQPQTERRPFHRQVWEQYTIQEKHSL